MKVINWAPANNGYEINMGVMCLFFLLMLVLHTSVAQKTDKEGYVVTNTGDTITGMFSAARWDVSPKQVSFNGPKGKEVFKPLDIKSFYVAGEFYESTIVKVDHSTGNLQNMNYSAQPEFIQDTLFVQVIFRGSKSLYYSKNANDWKYFFIKDGINPIEQLIYKKYLVDKQGGGGAYVVENNFYIRQLKVLFGECTSLGSTVDHAKYERNNLVNLFKNYAKCVGEQVNEDENLKHFRFAFQGIVGINYSYLKFYSDVPGFSAFAKGDFQPKLSPDIGLGISVNSLRRDRLSLNLFLLYTNLQVIGSHYSAFENKETNIDLRYNCFSSNLNLGFRPISSVPFYLSIGGTIDFLDQTRSDWEETYSSSSPREKDFESRGYTTGFISSLGYQLQRIGFELMYQRTSGLSNFQYLGSRVNRFHFLVKYNIISNEH